MRPYLVEELKGIAEGAQLPFETICAMNFRTWNYVVFGQSSPKQEGGCSNIAFQVSDRGTLVGSICNDPREPYVLIRYYPDDGLPHISMPWLGTVWGHRASMRPAWRRPRGRRQFLWPTIPHPAGKQPAMLGLVASRVMMQRAHNV